MSVCIIRPNAKHQYGNLNHLRAIEPPLWIALYARLFKDVKIIDMEAFDFIPSQMKRVLTQAEAHKVIIFATGSHPSAHIQQKEAMNEVAEISKNMNIETETYDYLPFDPTTIEKPNWDILNLKQYRPHNWHTWGRADKKSYGAVYTSISCPYNCEFCCIKDFYKQNYKVRKVEDVITDFTDLYNNKITNFKIMDELFVTKSKRTYEICDELSKTIGPEINSWAYARIDTVNEEILSKMRKAGVRWLAYGIESGNDDIRRQIMKGKFTKNEIKDIVKMTQDNGIHIVGNYMFGFWEDNKETMRETLSFAKELNTEYANFYCTVAYPGSKLYEDMKSKNIELPTKSSQYAQMSSDFLPLATKYLKAKEVLEFRDKAFDSYYSRADYLQTIVKAFDIDTIGEVITMLSTKIERNI